MNDLFPSRWKQDRPPSIDEFLGAFPDDYACAEYLARKRWPRGFVCPRCGGGKAWRLEARPWLFECSGCRKQTSVIAGTVMHGSHLPLRKWFLAAYLSATHSNGISALQLQPKIGVTYKTAWLMLHKLRRSMVNPDRTALSGIVEVDETSVAYRKKDDPVTGGQGRSPIGKMFIIGAVEVVDTYYAGRIRLARIPEISRAAIMPFVLANVEPGSLLVTDGNAAYLNPPDRGHKGKNLSVPNALPAHIALKWIHRVFSNMQRWAMGTFHGFREKHLDAYLNEFVFRWNRRRFFRSTVDTLLGIGQRLGRTTWRDIVGDTSDWKRRHKAQVLAMVGKERLEAAKAIAKSTKRDIFDVITSLREEHRKTLTYKRRPPTVTALPPRRPGEERQTVRYAHPPRPPARELALGVLRHIPKDSPLARA